MNNLKYKIYYRKKITLLQNVMYAAATWDFFRVHYDNEYVKEEGLKTPVCDGQMLAAILVKMISERLSQDSYLVRRFSLSYRKMALVGDTLTFKANVVKSTKNRVVLKLTVTNQRGEHIVSDGKATVVRPNQKEEH